MQHDTGSARSFNQPKLGVMMIFGLLKKKNANQRIVERQYGHLTAAARQPYLYERLDVPDTVMGRLEMLSAVMIVYFRRTRASATSGQEIAQQIVDAFFQDIDHSIRELGISDVGVPKRMKKLAARFYGRLESYAAALDAGDETALAQALKRNIYPETGEDGPDMQELARYLFAAEAHLTALDEATVEAGEALLPPAGPAT
ncbi:ubiquinol-cytochrome C chaperone [Rhizobium sp. TRM96647]|uniref:ubiquinol-cytochrome C chaperone family protein n=1 Tax=unclassified Rhizobium TaxID=2613769 RepID=UPI0021E7A031|nr:MULTISPECIES: ubiquinol-cytochrome C chaperone family protein [unclassified Rhizobium]MCV3738210.1 ubiquinol-cytochrome C chaperone [Rhizobium sp. TRM96647]MCV3760041.1 ubiquinol-cytochrome C chaperone [Rhizobium sp. TRM96650]